MTLNELTLVNFKAHKNRTFKFNLGINGIIGPNGAGKSCIIEAISFLFTGNLSKKKEETIANGSADGYVRGSFTLHSKQGVIERHLGSSKVVLEYDNKKYLKSKEVLELWDDLLDIDKSIFENVIVAKQNEIPSLFSGDEHVRERVFQKIFMVPPTDKIRNVVYNYIKNQPPLLLEENTGELQLQIQNLQTISAPVLNEIAQLNNKVLSETASIELGTKINFLKECIADRDKKPQLETKLEVQNTLIAEINKQLLEIQAVMISMEYEHYKKIYEDLLGAKILWKDKLHHCNQFDALNLKSPLAEETIRDIENKIIEYKNEVTTQTEEHGGLKIKIKELDLEITTMSRLTSCATCPTCKQPLADVLKFIETNKVQLAEARDKNQKVINKIEQLNNNITLLENQLKAENTRRDKLILVLKEFNKYKDVRFNSENFEISKSVVEEYSEKQKKLSSLNIDLGKVNVSVAELTGQLNNLKKYKGEYNTPEEELAVLEQVIQVNDQRKQRLSLLTLTRFKNEVDVKNLRDRIEASKANKIKNTKRNNYIKDLTSLYDILHVTEFPRQLIQTYSSVVEEELAINVQKFNFPYKPRIVEGFNIQMMDENGYVVPEVSGAQKVIVGLSLRMALHNLFSQSFPILIIDEGTTSMDEGNRSKYFETINGLRSSSDIKQFIIVDHDPMLAEVVDNVIKL